MLFAVGLLGILSFVAYYYYKLSPRPGGALELHVKDWKKGTVYLIQVHEIRN